jgi:hypothetical protein
MISIRLGEKGQPLEDVTNRLDNTSDVILDDIQELFTFKRAFADVQLRLGNLDRYFSTLFLSREPTTWWSLEVWVDSERKFDGRIESPITFDIKGEWVTFTAFSIDKLFWEKAQSTNILMTWVKPDPVWTLRRFLEYQLISNFAYDEESNVINVFQDFFAVLDMDPIYENRSMNFFPNYSSVFPYNRPAAYTYADLSPDNTIDQLLLDMAVWYNAIFFIDPLTGHVTMKQRQTVNRDMQHDIDNLLRSNGSIDVDDANQNGYDWVHLSADLRVPDSPTVELERSIIAGPFGARLPGPGFTETIWGWAYTYVMSVAGIDIESDYSSVVGLFTGSPSRLPYKAKITIPGGPVGTVRRRLFRCYGTDRSGALALALVMEISDNTTTVVYDNLGNGLAIISNLPTTRTRNAPTPTSNRNVGDLWISFDEPSGVWKKVIGYRGQNAVVLAGKILELNPKMQLNGGTKLTLYSFAEIFGDGLNEATFHEQWLPVFLKHRIAKLELANVNYSIGDSAVSSKGIVPNDSTPDNRLVINHIKANLTKEFSAVEMFTI